MARTKQTARKMPGGNYPKRDMTRTIATAQKSPPASGGIIRKKKKKKKQSQLGHLEGDPPSDDDGDDDDSPSDDDDGDLDSSDDDDLDMDDSDDGEVEEKEAPPLDIQLSDMYTAVLASCKQLEEKCLQSKERLMSAFVEDCKALVARQDNTIADAIAVDDDAPAAAAAAAPAAAAAAAIPDEVPSRSCSPMRGDTDSDAQCQ